MWRLYLKAKAKCKKELSYIDEPSRWIRSQVSLDLIFDYIPWHSLGSRMFPGRTLGFLITWQTVKE